MYCELMSGKASVKEFFFLIGNQAAPLGVCLSVRAVIRSQGRGDILLVRRQRRDKDVCVCVCMCKRGRLLRIWQWLQCGDVCS